MLTLFFSRGLPVLGLAWALYACSGGSGNNVNWGSANYAEVICAAPDAGCKSAAEEEREEEHRGHHGHHSRGGGKR